MRKKFSSRGKGGNHYLENMGRVTKKYTLKRWIGKFTKNFQVFQNLKDHRYCYYNRGKNILRRNKRMYKILIEFLQYLNIYFQSFSFNVFL